MNDSTLKTSVVFGDKASYLRTEPRSYSTEVHIDEMSFMLSQPYCAGKYTTVDFSDEKKMKVYRKINRMLGGN